MVEITCRDRDAVVRSPAGDVALDCLLAGIEAAHPETLIAERLSLDGDAFAVRPVEGSAAEYDLHAFDEVCLLGGGNAAGEFATGLDALLGDRLDDGTVVTDDPGAPPDRVAVLTGDHPLPSARGVTHTRRVLDRARRADEDDLVIVTISGGGSALLAAPVDPLSLSDLRTVTRELLASGATIDEINAVRKHCSAIKGGQLARAAAPATVVTLLLSDVVGNDPSVIASGPTVPDPSTYADATAVCDRYDLDLPSAVREHLEAGVAGRRAETPTAGDPTFERTHTHLLGSGRTALAAARRTAVERGYGATVLAAGVRGEASESALTHVAIAEECRDRGTPAEPPVVLLSGGETTVTLAADHGDGGPNGEFATSAGLALDNDRGDHGAGKGRGDRGSPNGEDPPTDAGIVVASVDTDGIDGATDAAGALVDADTLPEPAAREALARNDTYPLLASADALIRTGPTGTNVNDLRVIVVGVPGA